MERKIEKCNIPDNTLNQIWASLGLVQKQIVDSNNDQLLGCYISGVADNNLHWGDSRLVTFAICDTSPCRALFSLQNDICMSSVTLHLENLEGPTAEVRNAGHMLIHAREANRVFSGVIMKFICILLVFLDTTDGVLQNTRDILIEFDSAEILQLRRDFPPLRAKLRNWWKTVDKMLKMVEKQSKRLDSLEEKQGGSSPRKKLMETVLILGEVIRNSSHKRMDIWDPIQNNWAELNLKLPFLSGFGGAAYLNEEIYIFGGFSKYKMVQKLDKNMKWIVLADMNEGRHYISNSSLEMDGYIWVLGGCNGAWDCLKSVERYDPKEDLWTFMPPMNHPRHFAAATNWQGKIVACGGRGIYREILSSVECFDPEIGIWTEWEDLPSPRTGHALVSYYFQLVVMGGYKREYHAVDTVLELTPPSAEASWKYSASKIKKRAVDFPAVVLDCEIFAIGGLYDTVEELNRVEIFGENDEWRDRSQLPYECRNMPAIIIPLHYANRLCEADM